MQTKLTWEEQNKLYAEMEGLMIGLGLHRGLLATQPKGSNPKLEAQVDQDRERVKQIKKELG